MRSNAYCGNLLWQSSLTLQAPWNRRGAGRPVRRETPEGLVTLWAYDFTPSNVVVETMAVPASATNGIPFKTTVERTVENLRGDVLREETYIVTDSGRELLSWTDFERDAAGHELRRESSDGSLVERAWSCCGPEWEMDERGIVTVYSYDALGRVSVSVRNGVATLTAYDLAGNATNVTRFADALMASSSTGYDSAGRLVWNVGEDGVRTEYAYSTSSDGGEIRTTIRAADTDCAATNTVVSFRDGSTKASYLNGILKSIEVHEPFASATYEGTNGLASARWTRSETDFLGRTFLQSRPGFGDSTLVTSNLYDSAGRLSLSESLVLDPENIKHQTSNCFSTTNTTTALQQSPTATSTMPSTGQARTSSPRTRPATSQSAATGGARLASGRSTTTTLPRRVSWASAARA